MRDIYTEASGKINEALVKPTSKSNEFKTFTYHRNPTPFEIRQGYGAIHYADFTADICMKPNGDLKQWLVSPYDGLRYYL